MKKLIVPAATVVAVVMTSLLAATSERWLGLLVGDRVLLQRGQWWRAFTPVLVQPSGMLALIFLVLGAVVLLPPLLSRFDAKTILAAVLVAGLGCLALTLWRTPTRITGGSSDLIAALVGLWVASLAGLSRRSTSPEARIRLTGFESRWWPILATGYAVFFAVYLVLLPTGAGGWAPLFADVAVAVAVTVLVRWPAGSGWIALAVGMCALIMAVQFDGHGFGIVAGVLAALSAKVRRRRRPAWHPWWRVVFGLGLVAGIWLTWTKLHGVALRVETGTGIQRVSLIECLVAAAFALAVTVAATYLSSRKPSLQRFPLAPACAVVIALSCLGPLSLAADATAAAALITLHLTVGGVALWIISHHQTIPHPPPHQSPTRPSHLTRAPRFSRAAEPRWITQPGRMSDDDQA